MDKIAVQKTLNRIMEFELAGVVRYTHYALMVYGFGRIPTLVSSAPFDLDEEKDALALADEVDLPAGGAIVASEETNAEALEMLGRESLAAHTRRSRRGSSERTLGAHAGFAHPGA